MARTKVGTRYEVHWTAARDAFQEFDFDSPSICEELMISFARMTCCRSIFPPPPRKKEASYESIIPNPYC